MQPLSVARGNNGQNAGNCPGGSRVHLHNAPPGNRALNNYGVSKIGNSNLSSVARHARNLETTFDAAQGFADNALLTHALPPTVSSARTIVRCTNSTLKPL